MAEIGKAVPSRLRLDCAATIDGQAVSHVKGLVNRVRWSPGFKLRGSETVTGPFSRWSTSRPRSDLPWR